ncbi:MAG: pyridoxamine 5'-phosphate oxidase [Bryobacterales bacterium]|nr:pyridoxamine 5'-phosphate oxidase [Bryobacterales bacterium]
MNFAEIRREYEGTPLGPDSVHPDPVVQFRRWFDEALDAGIGQANAMALATASADGAPSARMVLLKGFDEHGFVFFTNYGSRKGRELEENPRAELVFYWEELHRQVRIYGQVERVSALESEEYFQTRPYEARVGAAVSRQSEELGSREELEAAIRDRRRKNPAGVERPPHWGGYRVRPVRLEFWQGRESRLHDRVEYCWEGCGWRIVRLFP